MLRGKGLKHKRKKPRIVDIDAAPANAYIDSPSSLPPSHFYDAVFHGYKAQFFSFFYPNLIDMAPRQHLSFKCIDAALHAIIQTKKELADQIEQIRLLHQRLINTDIEALNLIELSDYQAQVIHLNASIKKYQRRIANDNETATTQEMVGQVLDLLIMDYRAFLQECMHYKKINVVNYLLQSIKTSTVGFWDLIENELKPTPNAIDYQNKPGKSYHIWDVDFQHATPQLAKTKIGERHYVCSGIEHVILSHHASIVYTVPAILFLIEQEINQSQAIQQLKTYLDNETDVLEILHRFVMHEVQAAIIKYDDHVPCFNVAVAVPANLAFELTLKEMDAQLLAIILAHIKSAIASTIKKFHDKTSISVDSVPAAASRLISLFDKKLAIHTEMFLQKIDADLATDFAKKLKLLDFVPVSMTQLIHLTEFEKKCHEMIINKIPLAVNDKHFSLIKTLLVDRWRLVLVKELVEYLENKANVSVYLPACIMINREHARQRVARLKLQTEHIDPLTLAAINHRCMEMETHLQEYKDFFYEVDIQKQRCQTIANPLIVSLPGSIDAEKIQQRINELSSVSETTATQTTWLQPAMLQPNKKKSPEAERIAHCLQACLIYEAHLLNKVSDIAKHSQGAIKNIALDMQDYLQSLPTAATRTTERLEAFLHCVNTSSRKMLSEETELTFRKFYLCAKITHIVKQGADTYACEQARKQIKSELSPSNIALLSTRNDNAGISFAKVLLTVAMVPTLVFPRCRKLLNTLWSPRGKELAFTLSNAVGLDAKADAADGDIPLSRIK